ncbi:MAG: hypothetical protein V3S37_02355 [Dehalococcoidia bacterium]
MRDGIALGRAGHPTVVLVHDVFEKAARAQASALGMPDLRMYVFPQMRPDEPEEVEAAKAAQAVEAFSDLFQCKD